MKVASAGAFEENLSPVAVAQAIDRSRSGSENLDAQLQLRLEAGQQAGGCVGLSRYGLFGQAGYGICSQKSERRVADFPAEFSSRAFL